MLLLVYLRRTLVYILKTKVYNGRLVSIIKLNNNHNSLYMNKISHIVVFCLLTGCIPNNTNWAERLQEANQKASAYYDSLSEECLTDALNLYDEIADNSP